MAAEERARPNSSKFMKVFKVVLYYKDGKSLGYTSSNILGFESIFPTSCSMPF